MIPGITCDCRLWRRLFGSRQDRVRHQQFRRIADKPGGSSSAGDFQDALFIRSNDVRVADPDNRIISHLPSQVSERRTEYVMVLRSFHPQKIGSADWFTAR
jgi:hypothetical protein